MNAVSGSLVFPAITEELHDNPTINNKLHIRKTSDHFIIWLSITWGSGNHMRFSCEKKGADIKFLLEFFCDNKMQYKSIYYKNTNRIDFSHWTIAARVISRGLAYLSTVIHVRCLNFRVRNGNGCDTPAVAAIESQNPGTNRNGVDMSSPLWPLCHLGLAWLCDRDAKEIYTPAFMDFVWVWETWLDVIETISIRGLNTSLPSCVHPEPINRVFYPCLWWSLLFRLSFKLRCFQLLSLGA